MYPRRVFVCICWRFFKLAIMMRALCLLFPCVGAQMMFWPTHWPALHMKPIPLKLPNINFLANGYDVFYGNPQAEGRDPGFRQPILDIQYTESNDDGRWLIPDGVEVRESVMCSYESTTYEIRTSSEYMSSLSTDAKVAGGFSSIFASVKFHANTGFKSMQSETSSNQYTFVSSVAKCSAYEAFLGHMVPLQRLRRQIRRREPIRVTQMFRDAVANLPVERDESVYKQFLQTFGTHYVGKVLMGAKAVWVNAFSSSEYTRLKSQSFNFGVGAGASFKGASFEASLNSESEQKAKDTFESKRSFVKQFYIGSRPPTDGRWETWAHTTAATPYPIEYELNDICDLFTEHYLPDIDTDELHSKQVLLVDEIRAIAQSLNPTNIN